MSESAAPVVATPAPSPSTPVAAPPAAPAAPVVPEASLARERTLRAEQQKLAAERAAMAKEREELAAWKAERAKAAQDAADPLEQLKQTRESVEQLGKRLDEERAAAKASADSAALNAWRKEQIDAVKAAGDKYELTLLHGYASAVPARIEQHYSTTGEMLTVDQAAELVEKELEAATERSLSSKKWKSRTAPAVPAPAEQGAQDAAKSAPAPKTLTNALGTSGAGAAPAVLTDEQRLAKAIANAEAFAAARKK